jgi:hypothetical protein
MAGWLAKLRRQGLIVQLGVLSLAVVTAFAVIGPLAGWLRGAVGVAAAAVAAGVCFLGAAAALCLGRVFSDPARAWIGALAAMIPRMGVPMSFALFFYGLGGRLTDAGLLYYLIVFYPLTLAVETMLSLPETDKKRFSGKT